jgi:hypothetical protein
MLMGDAREDRGAGPAKSEAAASNFSKEVMARALRTLARLAARAWVPMDASANAL